MPEPVAGPGEVLVRVTAAGVNNADVLQRRGLYPAPDGAPPWPGLEISGTVEAVGPPVAGASGAGDRSAGMPVVGTAVVALLDGGGYAEHVVVRATQVLPVPAGVDMVAAAALPEAACTVLSTFHAARLRAGETLLVHGGSGGVGSLAVQLGAALGARVLTTAGGPDRAARAAGLVGTDARAGAVTGIDHRAEDVVARVRELTEGRGVDVVLDVLGGGGLADNLRCLAIGGRLAVIGLQQGRRGELDLGLLLSRRATVLGTTLRSRPQEEKARIVAAVREQVWPLVADGQVRPVVHAVLPLDQAARAHTMLESGEVFGKVLLRP